MANRQAEKERMKEQRVERERAAAEAARRRLRIMAIAGAAAAALAVAVVVLLLTSGGDDGGGRTAAPPAAVEPISDVHGVGVNPADGALYIASHDGLYRSAPGASSAARVDGPEQDLMGFTVAGPDRFFASGHPGPGQPGPPSLGLIESTDRGGTWTSVSLSGSDLHLLRAVGDAVYTFDGQLRASADGGRTWEQRTAPAGLIDLAVDPRDGRRVLAATQGGVQRSADGGRTWQPTSLEVPALLAWGRANRPAAIGGDGVVRTSSDGGVTWRDGGRAPREPAVFSSDADGALYVTTMDGAVDVSTDGGRNWLPRSRN